MRDRRRIHTKEEEAESEVKQPQAKEYQQPPEAEIGRE
jgi:hypothetical protein